MDSLSLNFERNTSRTAQGNEIARKTNCVEEKSNKKVSNIAIR